MIDIPTKRCQACKEEKPYSEYYRSARHGHRYDCKECGKAAARISMRKAPKERKFNSRLKSSYGINAATYYEMQERQGGVCALCGRTEPRPNKKRLSVDHCHTTGVVRDLLCSVCNVGLGHFQDDPSLLRKAAAYLERHAVPAALRIA